MDLFIFCAFRETTRSQKSVDTSPKATLTFGWHVLDGHFENARLIVEVEQLGAYPLDRGLLRDVLGKEAGDLGQWRAHDLTLELHLVALLQLPVLQRLQKHRRYATTHMLHFLRLLVLRRRVTRCRRRLIPNYLSHNNTISTLKKISGLDAFIDILRKIPS